MTNYQPYKQFHYEMPDGRKITIDTDKQAWAQYLADYGSTSFYLSEFEKEFSNAHLFVLIENKVLQGIYRCSTCGTEMIKDKVAGWPLFSGVACPECWAKHQKHLDDQRAKGQVCYRCRQPFDNCCC